jgi:hypothetical protein
LTLSNVIMGFFSFMRVCPNWFNEILRFVAANFGWEGGKEGSKGVVNVAQLLNLFLRLFCVSFVTNNGP